MDITSSYTGYNYDDVNDVWNAGERIYDAAMKHFTSKDPEAGNVYEKMRVNAYVYANNNPTTYTDPNGRSAVLDGIKNAFVSAKEYIISDL